ncbi:hypothetical protein AB0M41_38335 [Streptomyces sp. NPDC051896]|uniref:hypothetical protein n=1 Tax=Streptomyces sp. NPDC051896 TaxID=3155416 RepID=UPI003438A596
MSAANDQVTGVVFAQLTGAYRLGGTDGDCRPVRAESAPRDGLTGDAAPDVAERLARWRQVMIPVAVFTIIAAFAAVMYA